MEFVRLTGVEKIITGTVVKSISGHDKNRLYVVVDISEKYIYIADGDMRKIESPKKKNIKHLRFLNTVYDGNMTNKQLKRYLKDLSEKIQFRQKQKINLGVNTIVEESE